MAVSSEGEGASRPGLPDSLGVTPVEEELEVAAVVAEYVVVPVVVVVLVIVVVVAQEVARVPELASAPPRAFPLPLR